MKNEKIKSRKVILAALFLAWIIFNFILLIGHELWRDEANVWLMAKNLNPLQLFAEIKYQGHPCLWYLLVMPFAKVGLPFQTIAVLSFLVMSVCVGIFLWKAPLHMFTKAVCIFSPIFTYYYSVIARNYCLIALVFILLAWFYPKRNDKPLVYGLLLGLLVQTDTIALAGAGLISLMWLWEGIADGIRTHSGQLFKKVFCGIWIPFVSLLLWAAQFMQVSDSPHFQIRELGVGEFLNAVRDYLYVIMMRMTGQGKSFCTVVFLIILALGIVISVKIKNAWPLLVTIGSFVFEAVFSVLVYQLHIWHFISLCFVCIWMLWIWHLEKEQQESADKVTTGALYLSELWIIVLALCMFARWNAAEESSSLDNALHGLYSDGVNAAEYIDKLIPETEIIVSTDVPMASTVLAYLGNYECFYAGNGQKATYADYSEEQDTRITLAALVEWAEETFPDKQEIYLLDCKDSCLDDTDKLQDFEILYQSQEATAKGEEYILYRIPLGQ